MRRMRAFFSRLLAVIWKDNRDRDFIDELETHLRLHTEDNIRKGMSPAEARRDALIRLGGVEQTRENYRDRRLIPLLDTFRQDVSYAVRIHRKSPGFAGLIILTLALGIGANTALFSIVKGVLLKAAPYADPDRLVTVAEKDPESVNPVTVSYGVVEDWKGRSQSFKSVALYRDWTPTLTGYDFPELLQGRRVSRNFFETLGISPALGRGFRPEEDRPGQWHVALLSHAFWMSHFGGRPEIVGKSIMLNQVPFQIVGVLPATFKTTVFKADTGAEPVIWAPLGYDISLPYACRDCQHLRCVARLDDGTSVDATRAQMNSVMTQLSREYPKDYPLDISLLINPLSVTWTGKVRGALWLLLGATTLLLLIACANVSNLLLFRASKRQHEITVRSALGASRTRIGRQLTVESVMLSIVAGSAGVGLAFIATRLLTKFGGSQVPRMDEVRVDTGVLIFTAAVSLATGVLMGLAPALHASRTALLAGIVRGPGQIRGGAFGRFRAILVAGEVCLAVILTIASGLLLKSFMRTITVNPGFEARGLYTVNFALIGSKYNDNGPTIEFEKQVMQRISAMPGVDSAGIVSVLPSGSNFDRRGFHVQERHIPGPQVPSVDAYAVSAGYFHTMGIPLLKGRLFTEAEAESGAPVAVISETTARQKFPGQDPIGEHIQLGGRDDTKPWLTIVGVVGDVRQYGLAYPATPQVYQAYGTEVFTQGVLVVRSSVSAALLTSAIKEKIQAMDKDAPVYDPHTMEEILDDSMVGRKFVMGVMECFGALALILASVGIYGVVSSIFSQRTNEIGVRMALGASRSDIISLVMTQASTLVGGGLLTGLASSIALSQVVASQLNAVSATDPTTYILVLMLLALTGGAACLIPARRATAVDPNTALRYE